MKKKKRQIYPIVILIASLFMGIGYASVNSVLLEIAGVVEANLQNGIYITDVSYDSSVTADYENSKIIYAHQTMLNSNIILSETDPNSSIIYKITVYNSSNDNYMFEGVKFMLTNETYSNEGVTFKLSGLNENDILGSKENITFTITFCYKDKVLSDNNTLTSLLNFSFKKYYTITYENIINNGYPTTIMEGYNLDVKFVDTIPESILLTGSNTYSYNAPDLHIENVNEDIVIFDAVVYRHDGDYILNGSNYINTDVRLFSEENINKNFEITFSIVDYNENQELFTTLFNSMDESNNLYPGSAFRFAYGGNKYELVANYNSNHTTEYFNLDIVNKVTILRINNIIYYKINDEEYFEYGNYSNFTNYFETPVTFGASLNSNGEPYRFFVGILKDIKIKYLSDNANIDAYNFKYRYDGDYKFNGSNYINTGVYLFKEENITKDFLISFAIYNPSTTTSQITYATLLNIMNEANNSFPGIVFRIDNNLLTQYQLVVNGNTNYTTTFNVTNIQRVKILRESNILYYSINDGNYVKINDFTEFKNYFEVPVTFGASLNSNGEPYRFFNGTISAIKIRVRE